MFDLGVTKEQEIERQKQEEEEEKENKDQGLPLYQPYVSRKKDSIAPHPYNLRSRKKTGQFSGRIDVYIFVNRQIVL